ncbi:MAG: TlpA family protein disulfide reductase [Verrucomicrobiales bacterium]|nr:TlpA family protein disulfide reductase [Verrucomicrobiales bacterium]
MDATSVSRAGRDGTGRTPKLALASLVLGVLGLAGSVVVLGGVLAVLGLGLGWLHLRRATGGRMMGWAGVWFSVAGLVASVAAFAVYATILPRLFVPGIPMVMDAASPSTFAEWNGKPAPDFEVTALDGSRLRLSELRGRPVILDFWATWCGPCVMEIPHFSRLHEEAGADGPVVVGLSREDRAVLKAFTRKQTLPYTVASVLDVDLPEPFSRVRALPTTFFVDRSGIIRRVLVGYHDFDALKREASALVGDGSDAGAVAAPR